MKADIRDKSSGIWLSFDDQPSGRSHTAASGVTTAQFLEGGKGGLPKLDDIIRLHNPQVACVLLGTNDLNSQTSEVFAKNLESIIVKLLANKTIPVITTVPPGVGKMLSCCNTTSLFGSSAKNTKSQLSITTVRL
jgi:lysophospholipase L1-like esterase